MEEMIEQSEYRRRTKKKDRRKNSNKIFKILLAVLCIVIWVSVVYFGYTTAKSYIDTSIKNVQQQNAMNLDNVNEQILQLKNEIKELRLSMDETDDSLSDTSSLQEDIDDQLDELDERLDDLEKSLKILQEAP